MNTSLCRVHLVSSLVLASHGQPSCLYAVQHFCRIFRGLTNTAMELMNESMDIQCLSG